MKKTLYRIFLIIVSLILIFTSYNYPFSINALNDSPIFNASLSSGTSLEVSSNVTHTLVPKSSTDLIVTEKLTITFTESLANASTLTIAIPSGLKFVGELEYSDSFINRSEVPDDFYTVYDIDSSTPGIQQDTGTYINESAGTYTILLQSIIKGDSITISFDLDSTIWSHRDGSVVAPNKVPLAVSHQIGDTTHTKKIDNMNASARNITGYIEMYIPPVSEGGIEKVPLGGTSSINSTIVSTHIGQSQLQFSVKELTVTMTKPNTGGKYAAYVAGSLGENEDDSITVQETNTELIIRITNYQFVVEFFKPEFFFSDEDFDINNTLNVSAKVTATPYFGTQGYPTNATARTDTVQVVGQTPSIGIVDFSSAYNTKATQPGDQIELLAIMGVSNNGAGAANGLTLNYDFDRNTAVGSRNKLDVVSVNLPYPTRYVDLPPEITIVFQDAYGQNKVTKTFTNKTNVVQGENILTYINVDNSMVYQDETDSTILDRTYYIESVTYSIPALNSLEVLGTASLGITGGVFGYANSTVNTTASNRLSFTADNISGSSNFFTRNTNIKANASDWKTPYLINSIFTDKQLENVVNGTSEITAGQTVTISAELGVHDYPYTNSTNVPNPIIYIVEPEGFNIKTGADNEKIIKPYKTVDNRREDIEYTIDPNVLEIEGLGKVYKIILGEGFGLFSVDYLVNSDLSKTPITRPTVEVEFVADSSLINSSIVIDDLFYLVDDNIANSAPSAGAIGRYLVNDVYNIDDTHAMLATANETDVVNIVINKSDIVAQASINSQAATSYEITNDTINNSNNSFNYILTVDNRSEEIFPTNGSMFYVPLISGTKLTGAINVSGVSDYYTVYYSTSATEGNITTVTDWVTQVDDFSQVTAIRITGNLDYTFIPGYSRASFSMPMMYTDDILITDGGKNVSITTYEWEKYIEGIENTDNTLKQINTVTLQKKYISRLETSIVADPRIGNQTSIFTDLEDIPFITQLFVSSVTPYNVNLVDHDSISGDASTVEVADETFGIVARIGTTDSFDFSNVPDINSSVGTLYGAYDRIMIKLSYYDNFFDENTTRYVDVVFTNKAGVEYHVRINIEREPYIADVPSSGIIGGKYYSSILTNDTLTLTQDSAFTAQFVTAQAGSDTVLTNPSISIENGMIPIGTKINIVHTPTDDYGNPVGASQYLYYEVDIATSELVLDGSKFKDNHTGQSPTQLFSITSDTRNHIIQIIVDFSSVNKENYIIEGENNIRLKPNTGAPAQSVPFTISNARSVSIVTEVDEANADLFTLTTTVNADVTVGYDYKYLNKYAALKISAVDLEGNPVSPPDGAYISIDGVNYPAAGETYFIYTLGRLSSNTFTYTFIMPLTKLDFPEGFEMTVQTDLYISDVRENGLTSQVATTQKSFEPLQTVDKSLDITVTNQIIEPNNDSYMVPLEIRYSEGLTNSVLTIELYKKNENEVYELISADQLSSIITSKNYYFLLSSGKIIKYAGGEPIDGVVSDDLTLVMPKDVINDKAGTYRISIKSSGTSLDTISESKNFILLP